MSRLGLLTLVLLLACGPPCGASSATVERVVDGDTIELTPKARIRLLSVDTPEITSGKHDCYGQEAAAFTAAALLGKVARLTYDSECTDRYGRTLAYVTVGTSELNTQLVREGYACALAVGVAGRSRAEEFATYEAEARTARLGMWGACSRVPCASR